MKKVVELLLDVAQGLVEGGQYILDQILWRIEQAQYKNWRR
jgi:hypothetical protein